MLAAALSSDAARAVLAVGPVAVALARAPVDRLTADRLDRAVKKLDVLNVATPAGQRRRSFLSSNTSR